MLKIVEYKLPKDVFGQPINLKLLSQANYVYSERAHVGLRSTKTRSEVNRTTKKIYKQKINYLSMKLGRKISGGKYIKRIKKRFKRIIKRISVKNIQVVSVNGNIHNLLSEAYYF